MSQNQYIAKDLLILTAAHIHALICQYLQWIKVKRIKLFVRLHERPHVIYGLETGLVTHLQHFPI